MSHSHLAPELRTTRQLRFPSSEVTITVRLAHPVTDWQQQQQQAARHGDGQPSGGFVFVGTRQLERRHQCSPR
ncbi:unnamed protein product [Lampetra fluviatilis]